MKNNLINILFIIIIASCANKADIQTKSLPPLEKEHSEASRMLDFNYIINVLSKVFGPETKTLLKSKNLYKPSIFGSTCDPMRNEENCNNKNNLNIYYGKQNVLSASMISEICFELVSEPKTFRYILKNLQLPKTLDENSINKIYSLFPHSKSLNSEQQLNILKKANQTTNPVQTVIYTFCTNPDWFII